MTFVPTLPQTFSSLNDPDLKKFLINICDKKKISSFANKSKAASKAHYFLQTFQDRHYLELVILILLGRKEGNLLFKLPDRELVVDSMFEGAEFISVFKDVYRQTPVDQKHSLKGHFNSGFDGLMGMIPLAHEMNVAYILCNSGFEVEFAEYSGTANYDFSARKGDVTVQIDCKACSGDNGKLFKIAASGAIFDSLKKTNRVIFDGKILCLSIIDRDNIPRDVPLAVKKAIDDLQCGSSVALVDGVSAELLPFDTLLANHIQDVNSGDDVDQQIISVITDSMKVSKSDWNPFIEWVYIMPPHLLDTMRFACLLCSSETVDWRKNIIRVVKKSLLGQLKNCPCPVIFLRFSDLSDREVSAAWFTETKVNASATLINPLDTLFNEIVADSIGSRLCAMFFQHRPRFHETTTLGPTDKTQTIGKYPIRSFYNSSHPQSDALQAKILWHNQPGGH